MSKQKFNHKEKIESMIINRCIRRRERRRVPDPPIIKLLENTDRFSNEYKFRRPKYYDTNITADELIKNCFTRADVHKLAVEIVNKRKYYDNQAGELDEECTLLLESVILHVKEAKKYEQSFNSVFQILEQLNYPGPDGTNLDTIMLSYAGFDSQYTYLTVREMCGEHFDYVCARTKSMLLPFVGTDPCGKARLKRMENIQKAANFKNGSNNNDEPYIPYENTWQTEKLWGVDEILLDSDRLEAASEDTESFRNKMRTANPIAIKKFLDKTVIGQEQAKRSLSVALAHHMNAYQNDKESPRLTTLLIGPSGSGKTMLAKKLSEYSGLPHVIVDASQLTADGWKGLSKSDILETMFSRYSEKEAEYGIVVLDEFDKMCRNTLDTTIGKYARLDQETILGMLDGTDIQSTPDKINGRSQVYKTRNLFFILTGAFSEMESFEQFTEKKGALGFGAVKESVKDKDIRERLMKFGMLPELVGRIKDIEFINPLSEDDIVNALMVSGETFLKKYEDFLKSSGKKLHIKDETVRSIVKECIRTGLGVRGAQNKIEEILRPKIFEAFEDGESTIEI